MSLTYTDIFCGAGGSSIGLTEAGLKLKLAANHWPVAIETHSANFRDAEHLCADVNNYDMRRLPRTDVLWASPICTENSPAGGRKRRPKGQLDLLEEYGHVPKEGMERTRATFHDVFAQPVTVAVGGNTYERPGSGYVRAWPVHDAPMGTRNCTSEQALATPSGAFLTLLRSNRIRNTDPDGEPLAAIMADGSNHGLVLPVGGANHDQPGTSTGEPMRTRVTRDTDALVTSPFITMLRGSESQPRGIDDALDTITTGRHHGLTVPPFIVKNHGGYCTPEQNVTPVSSPVSAVTARPGHALVVPYRGRRSRATSTAEPLHTLATRDSAALVQPDDSDVAECRLRMLKPREHLRAQRFPDAYVVKGNQGEQTMQAGNAVSANVAHWLGRALAEVL